MPSATYRTALASGIALASVLLLPASGAAQESRRAHHASGHENQQHVTESNGRWHRYLHDAQNGHDEDVRAQNDGERDDRSGWHHEQGHHGDGEYNNDESNGQHDDGEYEDGEHNDGDHNDVEHQHGDHGNGWFHNSEADFRGTRGHALLSGMGLSNAQRERLIQMHDRHLARTTRLHNSLAQNHDQTGKPE